MESKLNLNPSARFKTYTAITGNNFRRILYKWSNLSFPNKNAKESIVSGFEHCLRGINGLNRTLDYLDNGLILLFGTDIPQKLMQDSETLSKIAGHDSYLFSGYLASVEIIMERVKSIQSLANRLHRQEAGSNSEYKNLRKQLRELKRDYIILAETELLLLERLVLFQGNSFRKMKNRLRQAA